MFRIIINTAHQKFRRDAIEFDNASYYLKTRGVFLGIDTREKELLVNTIISGYEINGEKFASVLRGSFLIYLLDKKENKHLVFTNHLGDQRVFYCQDRNNVLVSTSIENIIAESPGQHFSLDRDAAYYMLTYGHMFGNHTLIEEVKRLNGGQYLRYKDNHLEILDYYRISNEPDTGRSEKDIIEELDNLFRKAIDLGFCKDQQYGYAHICSLSGGLDSRMTTWVANEMGYDNITSFTFSQSEQPDITIARKIANDLGIKSLFHPLDSGSFMTEFAKVSQLIDATTTYLSISHGYSAVNHVDFSKFGLLHTGQLGDVTVGSYMTRPEYARPVFSKARSTRLLHKLTTSTLEDYENLEMFLYRNRGLLYILTGNVPVQVHSETVSPFLDVDFLDFCMSIPLKLRINHRLYRKWILGNYPDAASYPWERLGSRISAPTITIRNKIMTYSSLPGFVYNGIRIKLGVISKKDLEGNKGMNPFEYWYKTNSAISGSINGYFNESLHLIDDLEMREDCRMLFEKGDIHEKSQVISLLAGISMFFN
jgi:asparagine synthase (glutamine-hydrolysing)